MTLQDIAKKIVLDYANEHIDKTDNVQITLIQQMGQLRFLAV